ncbi:MAG: hypothetical protein IIT46_18065 [Lachnospiraceae bacterium]|nr:hypothetical protein [Lachnospiraceae bacterium]
MGKLSAQAEKVYNLLKIRTCEQDNSGTYCIYPRKEIAQDSGTNEKTVQRALNELEEKNYILRHAQRRQAQRIYFVPSNSENVPLNYIQTMQKRNAKSLFLLDIKNITKAIHLLHSDGELFEIRLINGSYNASGYFTSADTAIEALQNFRPEWNARTKTARTSNIFITLNPINLSCYSRKQHDCFVENANPTTKDNEITALHWLLIDLDPKRLSGVSSSEEELTLAKKKSREIYDFLADRGFKKPIRAMSGNGVHLVYRFDVPNTAENVAVFENALKVLSEKFSDEEVEVDTTVFNPARICKLWGTIAQKGATTPERPHRKAYIEPSTPFSIDTNDFTLLQALAAEISENKPSVPVQNTAPEGKRGNFDLRQFISEHNIPVKSIDYSPNGTVKYILEHCLFDESHKGKDAAILQKPDGSIGYKCFHNSCANKHWKDVRLLFEPDAYNNKNTEKSAKKGSKLSVYDIDGTGILTIENLANYMKIKKYKIWYNIIKHSIEYAGFKGYSEEHLPETAPTIIYNELQTEFEKCSIDKIATMLLVIASNHRVNPILDMITSAKWDGKDRIEEIYNIFGISKEDKLSREIIRKWLMQAVCGLFNDSKHPFSLDLILVFKGKQGIGKTRFFEHLAMLPQYFGEGMCIDPRNKDSIIQATSNWLCELGEIGSTLKKDIDSVKAMLTKANDEYRLPYGRATLKFPRMTSFVGTVNDDKFLIDQTGNRRFATVPISDDVHIDYNTQIRTFNALQLWAQVYRMVQEEIAKGATIASCFRLDPEMKEELDSRNEEYTKPMKAEDEVIDILSRLNMDRQKTSAGYSITDEYMTVTEFMAQHSELSKYTAEQVGKVLTKLGYGKHMRRVEAKVLYMRLIPQKNYFV